MTYAHATLLVPFYTGVTFNTPELLHSGYGRYASDLAEEVNKLGDGLTFREGDPLSGGTMRFNATDRYGTPMLPRWLIGCKCDAGLTDTSASSECFTASVTDIDVRVFDFGVGVVAMRCGFDRNKTCSHAHETIEVVRELELLGDSLGEATGRLTQKISKALSDAIEGSGDAARYVSQERPFARLNEAIVGNDQPASEGTPLWVHRILFFPEIPNAPASLDDVGSLVSSEAFRLRDSSAGTLVVPGLGTTVVVSDEFPSSNFDVESTLELVSAYWAGYSRYARSMLWAVSELAVISQDRWSSSAQATADDVVWLQERVLLFRAIVDHQGHNLSPDARRVWSAVESVWRIDSLFERVSNHVETVDELAQHIHATIEARRSQRLNNIVTALAVISATAVVTDLFSFFGTNPASVPLWLRIPAIALPFIAALGVVALVHRD